MVAYVCTRMISILDTFGERFKLVRRNQHVQLCSRTFLSKIPTSKWLSLIYQYAKSVGTNGGANHLGREMQQVEPISSRGASETSNLFWCAVECKRV